jgi:HSP20 family molecular chaperone IbpA
LHVLELPFGPFERRVQLPAGGQFELGAMRLVRGLLFVEVKKRA